MAHCPTEMPNPEDALAGRAEPIETDTHHHVSGHSLKGPYPEGFEVAVFAMGCFWGVERLFWNTRGVWVTAVGYTNGYTPNPTYQEVRSGKTGHAEAVMVVYDPTVLTYFDLLKLFWENHDPTTGMRQGPDEGTQYRSGIYYADEKQKELALWSQDAFSSALSRSSKGEITTEIVPLPDFYFAEGYHQGYLEKNPTCYCGLSETKVCFPGVSPPAD